MPYIFNNDLRAWVRWKSLLAELIDIDPHNIVLTGSAAIGFSLNPKKNFKKFDDESDVDCGIVSDHYFDVAWRYLRQQRVSWLTIPRLTKQAIRSHKATYVFAGTIAADHMLEILPFGSVWQAALDRMRGESPTNGRDVKLRIYKDYDALRYYQASNITSLRDQIATELSGKSGDEERIVVEG